MDNSQRTWGTKRWIYLAVGGCAAFGAVLSFVGDMSIHPAAATALALVLLGLPLFASDELLNRFNRTFFRPSELWRK